MAEGSEASSSRLLILECPWVRIQPQTWQIFFLSIFFFCADFFNFFSFRDKKGTFINHVDPYLGVLDAKYQLYRNFSTRIYVDSLQCMVFLIMNISTLMLRVFILLLIIQLMICSKVSPRWKSTWSNVQSRFLIPNTVSTLKKMFRVPQIFDV